MNNSLAPHRAIIHRHGKILSKPGADIKLICHPMAKMAYAEWIRLADKSFFGTYNPLINDQLLSPVQVLDCYHVDRKNTFFFFNNFRLSAYLNQHPSHVKRNVEIQRVTIDNDEIIDLSWFEIIKLILENRTCSLPKIRDSINSVMPRSVLMH